MQSAPVGHAPHGAAAEAADIPQINYHGDVDFYHELELRRGFLEVLSNGRNERAEHGTRREGNDPIKAREQREDKIRYRVTKMKNIRGKDGKLRPIQAFQPIEEDCCFRGVVVSTMHRDGLLLCLTACFVWS